MKNQGQKTKSHAAKQGHLGSYFSAQGTKEYLYKKFNIFGAGV